MRLLLLGSAPVAGLLYNPTRLALTFQELGVDVHLATWDRERTPGLRARLEEAGIPVHLVEQLEHRGLTALWPLNRQFGQLARSLEADVVHVWGPTAAFQVRRFAGGTSRARHVAMIEAMGHSWRFKWFIRVGAWILNRYTDAVVALCKAERGRLVAHGVEPGKIRIIHNPLDCDDVISLAQPGRSSDERRKLLRDLGIPTTVKILACLANFQPRKRHDLLLRAFARLHGRFPDWNLVLCGDGEEEEAIRHLCHELSLSTRVHLPGRLPQKQAFPLLQAADAVVHASNAETFGYSMIEPILLGRPTLVTRVGIGHEVEAADVARVVSPDDLDELLEGLSTVMGEDQPERERERGVQWVYDQFDTSSVARRLLSVYELDPLAGVSK